MRVFPVTTRLKSGLFLAFAMAAGLSLTACSSIDSLFGDETDMSASDAPAPTAESAGPANVPDLTAPTAQAQAQFPGAAPAGLRVWSRRGIAHIPASASCCA